MHHELADFNQDRRILKLLLLAGIIGAISVVVAVGLLRLIALITNLSFFHTFSAASTSPANHHLGWMVIAVPVLGGLIIGLMARFGSERIRGHGIPEALEAILLGRSKMDAKVAVLKPLSSAISIGTGGPFGAEGPIIMTGGAIGSLFAQCFHLTASERKTLLVAGAAGGMSAIFATPVAAVLLSVELLLFEWKPRSVIPVAFASAVAAGLRILFLGNGPIFPIVEHPVPELTTLVAAVVAGLIAGLGSALLTTIVYGFEDLFAKLPIHWMWWPTVGGLVVGLGGLLDPRVYGIGYDTIHDLLRGQITGSSLLLLLAVKSIVWACALGSGTSGGVLAPLLIIGGALGAVEAQWMPGGDAGLWALVGMAAMMGGTMRSPFTAMIFAVELTHDVNSLPALMIASFTAFLITVLLLKRSILTEKLARRGHHVTREYSINQLNLLRVDQVMDRTFATISPTTSIGELAELLASHDPKLSRRHAIALVDEEGLLTGIITRKDVLTSMQIGKPETRAFDLCSRDLVVAFADELLITAVAKMFRHGIGRLPVVQRDVPLRPIGFVSRSSAMAAMLSEHEDETVRERGWAFKGN